MNGNKKESSYLSKFRRLLKAQHPKPSRQKNPMERHHMKIFLIRMNSPSYIGRPNLCGSTREDQDGRTTLESTPRKLKTRHKNKDNLMNTKEATNKELKRTLLKRKPLDLKDP
ncbi:hypothetical protein CR513_37301, partial [Mucuna pruriens]